MSIKKLLVGAAAGAMILAFAMPAMADTTITVKPGAMNNWSIVDDNGNGGSIDFVLGPNTVPMGQGSAQFNLSASNQGYILRTLDYVGTKLSDITTLDYWSYQPGPTLAVALQFDVRYHPSDSGYQGRLVFEPYQINGTVGSGWQEWNPLNGKWWASRTGPTASNGLCPQSNPCTWSEVMTNWPDASILGNLLFKAGSGWGSFQGNVDKLTIGVDDVNVTYDFEPVVRSATITSPTTGGNVYGDVNFAAYLTDDESDPIQWAVRQGTCTANTNTVFGNVDGHSDTATIDPSDPGNQTFSFRGDMSTMTPGMYCFIYNPTEDNGEVDIRETVQFNLILTPVENKDQCKNGGWKYFGDKDSKPFKNQGDCVSYVQSNDNAVGNKTK